MSNQALTPIFVSHKYFCLKTGRFVRNFQLFIGSREIYIFGTRIPNEKRQTKKQSSFDCYFSMIIGCVNNNVNLPLCTGKMVMLRTLLRDLMAFLSQIVRFKSVI